MLFKVLVVLLLLVILFSLGSGLIFLVRDKGATDRAVKALTVRIGLSLGLFVLLFIAAAAGWITPHGVTPV